jgi:hypothetical protein
VLQVELGWVMIRLVLRSWRVLMRLMGVAGAALLLAVAGCGGTHRTVVQLKAHSGSSAKSHQSGNGTRANRFPRRYLLGLAMPRRPLACPPNGARLNASSLLGLGVDATRRRVEGYGCTARVVILNGRDWRSLTTSGPIAWTWWSTTASSLASPSAEAFRNRTRKPRANLGRPAVPVRSLGKAGESPRRLPLSACECLLGGRACS